MNSEDFVTLTSATQRNPCRVELSPQVKENGSTIGVDCEGSVHAQRLSGECTTTANGEDVVDAPPTMPDVVKKD